MPVELAGRDQLVVDPDHVSSPAWFSYSNATNQEVASRSVLVQVAFRAYKAVGDIYHEIAQSRLANVSKVHWVLLILWVSLLYKYSKHYGVLYSSSALLATMCTNILLFGISDILAQSIACFYKRQIDPIPSVVDVTTHQIFHEFQDSTTFPESDGSSDSYSIFNEYGMENACSGGLPSGREQDSISETDRFMFRRWICFMGWGFFISFFQMPWYKFLNYYFTEDPTVVQVLERVLTDQLLYSPVSLYYFFMYSNYIMEQGSSETFTKKIEKLYLSTLGCNYLVWPLVQFINFLLMPKHFQVPFSSSVGLLWNCFLSMRNASNSV